MRRAFMKESWTHLHLLPPGTAMPGLASLREPRALFSGSHVPHNLTQNNDGSHGGHCQ